MLVEMTSEQVSGVWLFNNGVTCESCEKYLASWHISFADGMAFFVCDTCQEQLEVQQ